MWSFKALEGNIGFRILADFGFKGHRKLLYRGFLSFGAPGVGWGSGAPSEELSYLNPDLVPLRMKTTEQPKGLLPLYGVWSLGSGQKNSPCRGFEMYGSGYAPRLLQLRYSEPAETESYLNLRPEKLNART